MSPKHRSLGGGVRIQMDRGTLTHDAILRGLDEFAESLRNNHRDYGFRLVERRSPQDGNRTNAITKNCSGFVPLKVGHDDA